MTITVVRDIQKLDPGARIELFDLDATVLGGGSIYFHAGTTADRQPLVWKGNTYNPWPIEVNGYEINGRGQLPTPKMRVANIGGVVTALALAYDDLVGATVIRRRTLAKYLDGAPGADPTAELPLDVYYVERKISETRLMVEFELASALDVEGVQLPRRQVIANMCSWEYRGPDCGFTGGAVAQANDQPTTVLELDSCSKRLTGCKMRHVGLPLPYGSFPTAGRV